ncbi:L,D-transpeptidase ErfK/SrfK [Geoalkalibacter ferrihydriticus]|uniref:L,D-transpeptidase ErfK/SrfK n=2 Tax=Geoalkalibacter ferrihydriticus TaxID=392333 RepID=A0A1G9JWF0_9BACT|nr:L,D-transpeptidase ErfK/SrfK [Geoalkalibacter ferrihydriticus]
MNEIQTTFGQIMKKDQHMPWSKSVKFLPCLLLLLALSWACEAYAWQPRNREESLISHREPGPVVGSPRTYILGLDEDLNNLAWRAGVGYRALVRANPDIDPWLPPTGAQVVLPQAAVVPFSAQPGITINLAELRLYLIWREGAETLVRFYPIGIGREGRETPLGKFSVANRAKNPSWTPPPSVRTERPYLPGTVVPGPDNPLGDYWIGLNDHRIGLHGTNQPYGVGREVSSGCIRLYPEHIGDLFYRVETGTPVAIIYQPIKLGQRDEKLYLEVHPDQRGMIADPMAEVLRQKALLGGGSRLDLDRVRQALADKSGLPVAVSAQ